MQLESIITLANLTTRLQFLALERSLRAVGCKLPLLVIPYDENIFDLPSGSSWFLKEAVADWLKKTKAAHPMMRKYQCLTMANYHYVDTDCIFLSNPEEALKNSSGFVTCCGHWRDSTHTVTNESIKILQQRSTNWQNSVFNAGQFACDRALYDESKLIEAAETFRETILDFPHHDQPGTNLLVHLSSVPYSNLTLPPFSKESSWAGDYPQLFEPYWNNADKKPYMIHWAGLEIDSSRPIDALYHSFLTQAELLEFKQQSRKSKKRNWWSFAR